MDAHGNVFIENIDDGRVYLEKNYILCPSNLFRKLVSTDVQYGGLSDRGEFSG